MLREAAPSFICDEMLKKLARWLRIMGYDAVCPKVNSDGDIRDISQNEHRVILTRDKDLSNSRGSKTLRVFSEDIDLQIMEILKRFPPDRFLPGPTRCPACNGELKARDTGSIGIEWFPKEEVPVDVMQVHPLVYECYRCGKVYWTGSHWDGISERLRRHGFEPRFPE